MDERIRDGFLKIRSELLAVVLGICGISLVVKLAFLQESPGECITEYMILVGSPVYLMLRSHMLGVTQVAVLTRKNRMLPVVMACLVFLMVFLRLRQGRGAGTDGRTAVLSVLTFAVSFAGVWYLYQRHEKMRQKKLDSRYDEE